MDTTSNRFVPKLHPLSRSLEADDPMALHAVAVEGDPDLMIRGVVEEFAWLGWDAEHILGLFRNPEYPLLYGLNLSLGADGVRRRILAILGEGPPPIQATVWEAPAEGVEPGLVQIGPLKS